MGTGRNQSQQTIDFVNRSGETIPPHGLVRIEDTEVVNDQRIATGKKPDGTAPACAHLVNSYLEVLDTRQGNGGIPSAPIWIAYDSGSGTPAVGDEWGPVSSGWKLDASGSGFHIRSVAVGDVVLAVECGGGGGGCTFIEYTIVSVDDVASPRTAVVSVLTQYSDCPDVDGSNEVTVIDRSGCLLNEDKYDLVGRYGQAQRSQQDDWPMTFLCCPGT